MQPYTYMQERWDPCLAGQVAAKLITQEKWMVLTTFSLDELVFVSLMKKHCFSSTSPVFSLSLVSFMLHKKATNSKGNFEIAWQSSMWCPEVHLHFGRLATILSQQLPLT